MTARRTRDSRRRGERREGSALIDEILGNPAACRYLLNDERSRSRLLDHADATAIRLLLRSRPVVEQVAGDPGLAKRLLGDSTARDVLLDDPSFLERVVSDERTLNRILDDSGLTRRLLTDQRSRDVLIGDVNLLRRVARSPPALEMLLDHPPTVRKLLTDERCREVLIGDANLLARVARSAEALDALLTHPASLARFLGDPRAQAALLDNPGMVKKFLAHEEARDRLLRDRETIRSVLRDHRVVRDADFADRIVACTSLLHAWHGLRPYLPEHPPPEDVLVEAQQNIRHPNDVRPALLDLLCDGDELALAGARLRFSSRSSLWIVIDEILVAEEYFFPHRGEAPVIVDCGTNFGLSLYYFKRLYPGARIVGFEPIPALFELAADNVRRNDMQDVALVEAALSGEDGTGRMFLPHGDPLGACLRGRQGAEEGETLSVETRRLSSYLQSPVDFLKLDIEGAEDVVLEECGDALANVRHLFCEYHQGPDRHGGRLAAILQLLDRCGFDAVVGKSRSCGTRSSFRPLVHATQPYSACIWATRRDGVKQIP